jgi:hypothetical protein
MSDRDAEAVERLHTEMIRRNQSSAVLTAMCFVGALLGVWAVSRQGPGGESRLSGFPAGGPAAD